MTEKLNMLFRSVSFADGGVLPHQAVFQGNVVLDQPAQLPEVQQMQLLGTVPAKNLLRRVAMKEEDIPHDCEM